MGAGLGPRRGDLDPHPGHGGRAVTLTGADLTYAILTGADLTGADLTGADLTRATLLGTDLTGANLTSVSWPERAQVPDGWMVGSDTGRLKRADGLPEVMTHYL